MEKLRILDLFCGVGGTARGFQKYMKENNIEFEYHAVDIKDKILKAHKILNPSSIVIKRDAWLFSDEELKEYDFIWASPPCESHSMFMFYYMGTESFREPDMRLWDLIVKLFSLGVPFCIENVRPYYGYIIKPTAKIGRHRIWSNLKLKDVKDDVKFENVKDTNEDLMRYHEVPRKIKTVLIGKELLDALRDMMNWRLAYELAKQVIPQVQQGRIQSALTHFESQK